LAAFGPTWRRPASRYFPAQGGGAFNLQERFGQLGQPGQLEKGSARQVMVENKRITTEVIAELGVRLDDPRFFDRYWTGFLRQCGHTHLFEQFWLI
jgi:hypothetical protein